MPGGLILVALFTWWLCHLAALEHARLRHAGDRAVQISGVHGHLDYDDHVLEMLPQLPAPPEDIPFPEPSWQTDLRAIKRARKLREAVLYVSQPDTTEAIWYAATHPNNSAAART